MAVETQPDVLGDRLEPETRGSAAAPDQLAPDERAILGLIINWRACLSAFCSRTGTVGWVLLPQRLFVGATFVLAGCQKLANSRYLDAGSPASFQAQVHNVAATSPMRPLLGLVADHPTLFGMLVAIGEVAVGAGALAGLLTRASALGGALLAMSFFLTVSWHISPYYYSSDIVFFFLWVPLIVAGSGGVLSLDGNLAHRRAPSRRRPRGVQRPGRAAHGRHRLATGASRGERLERRAVLRAASAVGAVSFLAAGAGGISLFSGRRGGHRKVGVRTAGTVPSSPIAGPTGAHGTVIALADQVPVSGALAFSEPASGQPAYLVRATEDTFVAFSRVCTHAGCSVNWARDTRQFVCPCHAARFDGRTGSVISGPAPRPLSKIAVRSDNGAIVLEA